MSLFKQTLAYLSKELCYNLIMKKATKNFTITRNFFLLGFEHTKNLIFEGAREKHFPAISLLPQAFLNSLIFPDIYRQSPFDFPNLADILYYMQT